MKKLIALILTVLVVCLTLSAPAEEVPTTPLYATVGEAMEDDADGRVITGGIPGEYYAVVTQKDGRYYRSVAEYDEKLLEMEEALAQLDYEAEDFFAQHDAAMEAIDEYIKTLPIAYTEEFTAEPLTDGEMAALTGKTISELIQEGFEIGSNGTESGEDEDEIIIVYTLRYGVFDYECVMDAGYEEYEAAKENETEGELAVAEVRLIGITESAADRRFHTDGTVEEPEDPFAELSEIMTELMDLLEKLQSGEEANIDEFIAALKAKHPDFADMIDFYMEMYQLLGAEGFASFLTPAE